MASSSFRPGCIAQSIFYFAAYLLFQVTVGTRNRGESINWGLFLVVVVVVGILAKIGGGLAKSDRESGTKDRDEAAQSLIATLPNASSVGLPSFSLYLRPFSITGRLSINNPQTPPGMISPDMFSYESLLDIEEVLAQSLEPMAPLQALGHPGEAVGAGRIPSTEEGWRSDFELLAKQARVILVIPSSHSGTRWEIEWLKTHGALDRVIFVMPPSAMAERPAAESVSVVSEWELARSALGEIGITLPLYRLGGLLFTLDNEGHPQGESSFLFTSHRGIRKAVKELLKQRRVPATAETPAKVSWANPARVPWWKRRKLPTVSYLLITLVFAGTAFLCQQESRDDATRSPLGSGSPQESQSLGNVLSGSPISAGITQINAQGDTLFIPEGWSASRINERTVVAKTENRGAICQAVGYVDNKEWPADLFFLAAPKLEHDLIAGSEEQIPQKNVQVSLSEQEDQLDVLGYRVVAEIDQGGVSSRAFIRVLRAGGHALRIDCTGVLPSVISYSSDISSILSSAHLGDAVHTSSPTGQLDDDKLNLYLALASSFLEEKETQKAIAAAQGAVEYVKERSNKGEGGALKISVPVASKVAFAFVLESEGLETEGRLDEAARALKSGLNLWRKNYGLDDEEVMAAQTRLVSLLKRLGKTSESKTLQAEIDRFVAERPENPPAEAGPETGLVPPPAEEPLRMPGR